MGPEFAALITIIVTANLAAGTVPTAAIFPCCAPPDDGLPCIWALVEHYAEEEAREISERMIDLYRSTEKLGKLVDRADVLALVNDMLATCRIVRQAGEDDGSAAKAIRRMARAFDLAGDVVMKSCGTNRDGTAAAEAIMESLRQYARDDDDTFANGYDCRHIAEVVCPRIVRTANEMANAAAMPA